MPRAEERWLPLAWEHRCGHALRDGADDDVKEQATPQKFTEATPEEGGAITDEQPVKERSPCKGRCGPAAERHGKEGRKACDECRGALDRVFPLRQATDV